MLRGFHRLRLKFWKQFDLSHDVLRHTLISMFVGKFWSVGEASLLAGNSEAIIRKHYHDLKTAVKSDEFVGIVLQLRPVLAAETPSMPMSPPLRVASQMPSAARTVSDLGSGVSELASVVSDVASVASALRSGVSELGSVRSEVQSTLSEVGSAVPEVGSVFSELPSGPSEVGRGVSAPGSQAAPPPTASPPAPPRPPTQAFPLSRQPT